MGLIEDMANIELSPEEYEECDLFAELERQEDEQMAEYEKEMGWECD